MSSIQDIKIMIDSDKFAQANKGLNSILLKEPNNKEAQELKTQLQQKAYDKNIQLVDAKLKEYKELFKDKKYKQLIPKLQKLQAYAPGYSKLDKFVLACFKEYEKGLNKSGDTQIKTLLTKIDKLITSGQGNKAILAAQKAALEKKSNALYQKVVIDTKRNLINYKLKKNKKGLKKLNAPSRYEFLKKLYIIDKSYPKIQEIMFKAKKDLENYDSKQKKVYLKESKMQIKVLFNSKKYFETMSASKQLLNSFPNNSYAKKYYKKAKKSQIQQNYLVAYSKLTNQT